MTREGARGPDVADGVFRLAAAPQTSGEQLALRVEISGGGLLERLYQHADASWRWWGAQEQSAGI